MLLATTCDAKSPLFGRHSTDVVSSMFNPESLTVRITPIQRPAGIENRLLASLSKRDRQHLLASAKLVKLEANAVLVSQGQELRHVYFPVDCFISIFSSGEVATQMALAVVGSEGMLGEVILLGSGLLPGPAIVVGAGTAWRISRKTFATIIADSPTVRRRFQMYLHYSLINLAQQAACSHFHSIEARLARCLLMIHDRVGTDRLALTHQVLANLLGVRRVGITLAASALQNRTLIDYRRGVISRIDRERLMVIACDCYGISEAHYQKILG